MYCHQQYFLACITNLRIYFLQGRETTQYGPDTHLLHLTRKQQMLLVGGEEISDSISQSALLLLNLLQHRSILSVIFKDFHQSTDGTSILLYLKPLGFQHGYNKLLPFLFTNLIFHLVKQFLKTARLYCFQDNLLVVFYN